MNDFNNNNYGAPVNPQPQQQYTQQQYAQPQYTQPQQQYAQPQYAQPVYGRLPSGSKQKTTAGLLAIFLGAYGAHKFYLGYTTPAIIMLAVQLSCLFLGIIGSFIIVGSVFFIGCFAMWTISLIEGIIYLSKSDADFDATYVVGDKGWF